MNKEQLIALLEAQQEIVEKIALDAPLVDCLTTICEQIELVINSSSAKSSILLLDGVQLRHGAAPSIPNAYCEDIDGVVIGPNAGSCGTAIHTRKQVVVSDIETDPLWVDYKSIALEHNLKACWSTPIFSSANEILGSFAIYYTQTKEPDSVHLDLIQRFTHFSGLAIEKERGRQREQQLAKQLVHSNEKFHAFSSVMPDLGLIVDEDGLYVDIYGADSQLLYDTAENVLGRYICEVLPIEDAREIMEVVRKTLDSNEVQIFEYSLDVQKGSRVFEGRTAVVNQYLLNEPDRKHVLWMARDITERKLIEEKVEQLAFFDPLTALPNRRLLSDRLDMLISNIQRNDLVGALLFLDLDDFKRINDSLGHTAGDQILVSVAKKLTFALRDSDTIARIGGDEFVIILDTLEKNQTKMAAEATSVARKLLACFLSSITLGNAEYQIQSSIGISFINVNTSGSDEVLKRADTAMYRAKALGGNRFCIYDPDLQQTIDDRLQIERELLIAIAENQISAYFQPQVNSQGKVIGAEALIRWEHPQKGMISPLKFISVAEQCGLVFQLQDIVLSDACKLLKQMDVRLLDNNEFSMSINISACQFKENLEHSLVRVLSDFDVSPKWFKLEITESMLLDHVDEAITKMRRLKEMGFRFSIDDFGTGYSSLAYLHTLPVDELKIDRSFIGQIHSNKGGTAILDTIISLSSNLGFDVIAEGVEKKIQFDLLSARPVTGMQGYLFSHAITANQFIESDFGKHFV